MSCANKKFEKIKKAIETCSFRNLQQLETDGKFKEQTVDKQNKSVKFFHLGPENDWKKNLDKNISREIENKFKAEKSDSFTEALGKIRSSEKKLIVCFGSLYNCGNILNKN